MKKIHLALTGFIVVAGFTACNSDSNTTKATTTSTSDSSIVNSNESNNNNNTSAGTTTTNSKLPLNPQDSTFVMKAAMGGMMEVEAGNLAQQNAQSDRVKAYAAMMVKDHSNSNQELMSLSAGRGMTVPTTMPPDIQKHLDAMRSMKGKAFDNHYMKMMVDDHQKTVTDFQKQADGGADPDLKAFAAKTLPILQMHRDSATAINKAIK